MSRRKRERAGYYAAEQFDFVFNERLDRVFQEIEQTPADRSQCIARYSDSPAVKRNRGAISTQRSRRE